MGNSKLSVSDFLRAVTIYYSSESPKSLERAIMHCWLAVGFSGVWGWGFFGGCLHSGSVQAQQGPVAYWGYPGSSLFHTPAAAGHGAFECISTLRALASCFSIQIFKHYFVALSVSGVFRWICRSVRCSRNKQGINLRCGQLCLW